jgi:hypothetical protein
MKRCPRKPSIIIAQVEDSGTPVVKFVTSNEF